MSAARDISYDHSLKWADDETESEKFPCMNELKFNVNAYLISYE